MNLERVHVRVLAAIVAVAAMVIATPLHLAHSHFTSNPDGMRAPCAACQCHPPASTNAEPTAGAPAPSVSCGAPATPLETLPASNSTAPNACRAPPLLPVTG